MKRVRTLVLLLLSVFVLSGCGADYDEESQYVPSTDSSSNLTDRLESNTDTSQSESMTQPSESEILSKEHESVNIQITVGDTTFTAIPEENSSADALIALLEKEPITVHMSDYAGMEKVGSLGTSLPRNDTYISVDAGDVILYQGNQITIYYGTNSWSFTKLAVIQNATKERLLEALGSNDVDVTFSLAE